jgi:sugar (pentulose or hexulose) kinase
MERVIAVLDIGKTNKKIVLYDRKMKLLKMESRNFPARQLEDVRVEQVEELEEWFLDTLRTLSLGYDIAALSITSHGAAAVCVGTDGKPSVPVLDYTTEVDESVHQDFYREIGNRDALQRETGTAELKPLINVGKMLYFAKKRFPEEFAATRTILLYPQYFSFRLTGEVSADYTYLGCHTYLWNVWKGGWSDVVKRLGIADLLPERIDYPGSIAGRVSPEVASQTGLSPRTPVLVGVHDSNSSLIPYLLSGSGDFLLNSTGTWCVAMHPEKEAVLTEDDIGKTVFYNLSVNNTPVKTAVFMGGLEFETWFKLLRKINGRDDYPDFLPERAREIVKEAGHFILPGVVQGAGQYPDSTARLVSGDKSYRLDDIVTGQTVPDLFREYEKAFTVLLLSLALHSKVAFERAGLVKGVPIYTEGGFRQNRGYNRLLTSLFPENPVFTTGIDEATSFGAALLGWAAVEGRPLSAMAPQAGFERIPVEPLDIQGMKNYSDRFFSLLEFKEG